MIARASVNVAATPRRA